MKVSWLYNQFQNGSCNKKAIWQDSTEQVTLILPVIQIMKKQIKLVSWGKTWWFGYQPMIGIIKLLRKATKHGSYP